MEILYSRYITVLRNFINLLCCEPPGGNIASLTRNSGLGTTPSDMEGHYTFYNFCLRRCILKYILIYETLTTPPKEIRGLNGMYMPTSNIMTPEGFSTNKTYLWGGGSFKAVESGAV